MTVSLTGHPGRNTQDKGGEDRRRHEGDGDSHARRRALGGAAHAVAGGAATGHRCAVAQQRCTAEHERDRRPQREHIAHGVVPRPDLSALAKHLSNEQTTGEQTDEVPDPPDDDVASATDESGGLDIGAAGTERLVGHDEETDNQQTEDRTTDEPRQPVRKGIEHVQCLSSGERGERSGRLRFVDGGPGAVAAEQIGDVGESGRDEAAGTDRRAVAAGAIDDRGLRGVERGQHAVELR